MRLGEKIEGDREMRLGSSSQQPPDMCGKSDQREPFLLVSSTARKRVAYSF